MLGIEITRLHSLHRQMNSQVRKLENRIKADIVDRRQKINKSENTVDELLKKIPFLEVQLLHRQEEEIKMSIF